MVVSTVNVNHRHTSLPRASLIVIASALCFDRCCEAFSTGLGVGRRDISPRPFLTVDPSISTAALPVSRRSRTGTSSLQGRLWDRLEIEEDDEPLWYLMNCVAGLERSLLFQARQACEGFSPEDVVRFSAPTERKLRSHGKRNVVDEKVMYPGYVFCKIRMCPKTYETLQQLQQCRSWMGTANRKGNRKMPAVPCALQDHEIEKFSGIERDEGDHDILDILPVDTGDDLLDQYKGFEVDNMVKVLKGNFKGEDGTVRRLKEGKILVKLYTYGTVFEEWFPPTEVRPLTDLEAMKGLSGPTVPIGQDDFDISIGKEPRERRGRDEGRPGDRRNSVAPGGDTRNRRQDRVARGEAGKDFFGRDTNQVDKDEENWRAYREDQRQQQQSEKKDVPDSWGIKARSSWGGGDDAVYDDSSKDDGDGNWGRPQNQRPTPNKSANFERALEGSDDWMDFTKSKPKPTAASMSPEDDDFFANLMSELSDSVDSPQSSGASFNQRDNVKPAPAKSSQSNDADDDFFASLMSELSAEEDQKKRAAPAPAPVPVPEATPSNAADDDFFNSLMTELDSSLDESGPSKTMASPAKTPASPSSDSAGGVDDSFFAMLEDELKSGGKEQLDVGQALEDSGDDFFSQLQSELSTELDADPTSASSVNGGDDDFFASLEADLSFDMDNAAKVEDAPNKPPTTLSNANAAPKTPAAPEQGDLSKLTVVDLKEKLRERGLKVSGKKGELIERLQESG